MRLETFFEKFELFADAPNAVGKMRELILELAIQGKLVDQNPSEDDGHVLLNQIHEKNPSSISDAVEESVDTPLQNIPGSWAPAKLGEVAEIIRGVTFPGSAKSKIRSDNDVACLRTASVQAEIDWDDLIFISPSHVSRFDQWVMPNDIMISMANSYALVGKVAIVRQVPQRATFGAFLAAIRPVLIEPYFLLYVLRSPRMQAAFRNSSSQTTNIANISLGRMRPLPFPLPPLAEQKRIVAKVDELMALCDRLEAQQQERDTRHAALARASLSRFAEAPTPANLDFLFHKSYPITPAELRKSILTLAVQGLLVPQAPSDISASKLVDQIRNDANGHKKSQRGASRDSTDEENPYGLPVTWIWARAEDLTQPNQNITYGILKPVWVESGVPTVRVTEMKTGAIDINALPKCAAERAAKFSKTTLAAGDLLISKDGTIGKTAFVPPELVGGNITQHILRFAISKRLDRHFVRICIDAPPCQAWMAGETKGVALQGVNVGDFRRMPLPIPPLAEQSRIVAKVNQLMALVDQLEAQLTTSRATAEKLMEAVVSELTRSGGACQYEQVAERQVTRKRKAIAA